MFGADGILEAEIPMRSPYLLSFCTDFPDELLHAWFDRADLRRLFSLLRDWGMRRVYWMYYGGYDQGAMACSPYRDLSANAKRTYEHCGEFLPAAVEIGHGLGLEVYAVVKPFDTASPANTFPFGSPEAAKHGKVDCLSGRLYCMPKDVAALQGKRMRRHPNDLKGDAAAAVVASVKLTLDTRRTPPFDKQNLRLRVSDDNWHYRLYRRAYKMAARRRGHQWIVRLDGLHIKEPFLALACRPGGKHNRFGNTLDRLVTLYDVNGRPIPFTYGLRPRDEKREGVLASRFRRTLLRGFAFDDLNWALYDGFLRTERHCIDNPSAYTAIAKGKEPYLRCVLSPAYREVQAFWLKQIRECLDAGVDGVDVRMDNHNRSFEWERYGFEPPVARALRQRYGVDIRRERVTAVRAIGRSSASPTPRSVGAPAV